MKYLYCTDCGKNMLHLSNFRNCRECFKKVKNHYIFDTCQMCNNKKKPSIYGLCENCRQKVEYLNTHIYD